MIAIVLIAVLVNSCETSARNSALKDYNNSVASLNARSVQTGTNFFNVLSGGTSDPTSLQQGLDPGRRAPPTTELNDAKSLSVPDEVKGAQQDFVQALQMRDDGIEQHRRPGPAGAPVADEPGRGQHDRGRDGPLLRVRRALQGLQRPADRRRAARRRDHVGGLGGQQLNSSQFLPSIQWLDPTHVATALHVSLPSSSQRQPQNIAPGLHGHAAQLGQRRREHAADRLDQLSPGEPGADVHAQLRQHRRRTPRRNVKCKVTIAGTSVSGQTIVPQTTAGESTSCQVTLSSSPPTGPKSPRRSCPSRARRTREQLADVPGHVPVRSGVTVCCRQCTT